jgi:hypothetical protein
MKILGIALMVLGFALLCCGLIFYRSSELPGDEGERVAREEGGEQNRDQKPPKSDFI